MKSLKNYILAYRKQTVSGTLLVLAAALTGVGIPFLIRFAIDDLNAGIISFRRLIGYSAAYVIAALLSGYFTMSMRRVLLSLSHQVEYDIRRDVFDHLTRLDHAFFSRERTGDLMTKMTSDLNSVREFVGQGLLQGARTSFGFVLAFGVMFAINVRLALVMLVLLPCISLLFFALLRIIRQRYEASQEQFSVISNFAQENFGGVRTIRGYGVEDRQESLFQKLNEEYIARKMALSRVERPLWPIMSMLFSLGVVLLLWVGGRQVVDGTLTIGEFVQFTQYLFLLQWPMMALGWTVNLLQRGGASWKRIRSITTEQPLVRDGGQTDSSVTLKTGAVSFEDVHLTLGGMTVLHDIRLEIPDGATVGITGPTGSGKTLLAWMIPRIIDPTSGRVRVDGHDVRVIPIEALRRHIGMAPQEPFLFSDTLANNIALGLPETHEEKVLWAAEVAELSPDIEYFPGGYQTLLGERGVTLSGGQRQRTAISRAIARRPAILILDDVFSAIDTQTEANILARLDPVLEGRTSIIISHRVSTLRHADFIVVLESGRVTQKGPHRDLVQQPGYYRDLDEVQRLEAKLEEAE